MLCGLILMLSGCVQAVKQGEGVSMADGAYNNPQTWLRAAEMHEAQGDLQQALYEYRLAKTVSPRDYTIRKHLRRVETKIEERTANLLKKAERADSRGKVRVAKGLYLEILALQPDHQQALAALRQQEKSRTLHGMKKKQKVARQSHPTRTKPMPRNHYAVGEIDDAPQEMAQASKQPVDARKLLRELEEGREEAAPQKKQQRRQEVKVTLSKAEKAYQAEQWDSALELLKQAEQASNGEEQQLQAIGKARKQYARALYNQGVIAHRSEPQRAMDYWHYALKFDPEDDKSRLRIRSLSRKQTKGQAD
jgi:hypothetical protein